jgi:hypothetical protein
MSRTAHDAFAKDWFKSFLSDFGQVNIEFQISGEARYVDVHFEPHRDSPPPLALGYLGKMITRPCLIEPFRNAIPEDEICNCIAKSIGLGRHLVSESKRQRRKCKQQNLPQPSPFRFKQRPFLWMISPTLSEALQQTFALQTRPSWGEGIYFCPNSFRAAIIAVNQLPSGPHSLWLRMLGKGPVQRQAMEDLMALPRDQTYREVTLHHIAVLQQNLKARQNITKDLQEVIMTLAIAYEQIEADILQRGEQLGLEKGREEGREKGLAEGQVTMQVAIAQNMLREGLALEAIARLTGLSPDQLATLQAEFPEV